MQSSIRNGTIHQEKAYGGQFRIAKQLFERAKEIKDTRVVSLGAQCVQVKRQLAGNFGADVASIVGSRESKNRDGGA